MKRYALACLSILLAFSSSSLFADENPDGAFGIDYGVVSFKGKHGGKSVNLPSFRFNAFDTSGALTAGIRGALNQDAARKAKEAEIEKAVRTGGPTPEGANVNRVGNSIQGNYTYSWQQPEPTPTDGDRWLLTLATNGTPLIDAISPPSSSSKAVDSVLGVEYSSALWSMVSSPVSLSAGWGLKFFMFSEEGPHTGKGGLDSSSFSIPLNISASSQILPGLVVYGDYALSPISVFKGKGYYMHEEIGVQWEFVESWLVNASYRLTQDAVNDKDQNGDHIEYQMNTAYVGLGVQF